MKGDSGYTPVKADDAPPAPVQAPSSAASAPAPAAAPTTNAPPAPAQAPSSAVKAILAADKAATSAGKAATTLHKAEVELAHVGIDIKSSDANITSLVGAEKSELEEDIFGAGPDAKAEEAAAIKVVSTCCSTAKENAAKDGKFSCKDTIEGAIIKALPHLNYDLPDLTKKGIAFPVGVVFMFVFFLSFALLYWSGINAATSSTFLSPTGSSSSQTCKDIPQPVVGTYYADVNGAWSTSSSFMTNSSIYQVTFDGGTVNLEQYSAVMTAFAAKLKKVDDVLATRDVAFTEMAWASFIAADSTTKLSLTTTADVAYIFGNVVQMSAMMAETIIDCITSMIPVVSLSADKTLLVFDTPVINNYIDANNGNKPAYTYVSGGGGTTAPTYTYSTSVCSDAIVNYFGYTPQFSPSLNANANNGRSVLNPSMKITISLVSIMVAQALNYGLISTDDLVQVSIVSAAGTALSAVGTAYYHPSHPEMTPVLCITKDTTVTPPTVLAHQMCVIIDTVYDAFYLPSFSSTGAFTQMYSPISISIHDCNTCTSGGDGLKGKCQTPDSFVSLITYFHAASALPALVAFAKGSNMWQGLFTTGSVDTNLITLMENFMQISPGSQYMYYELLGANIQATGVKRMNKNGFQLEQLATTQISTTDTTYVATSSLQVGCKSSIYQKKALDKMISTPPVPLIASYKQCSTTTATAAQNTFGNAQATASVIAGSVLSIIMFVIVYHNNSRATDSEQKLRSTADKLAEKEAKDKLTAKSVPLAIMLLNDMLKNPALADTLEGETAKAFLAYQEDQKKQLEALHNKISDPTLDKNVLSFLRSELKKEVLAPAESELRSL